MGRFESRWWVVLASFLGLSVGAGTVYLSAFGVFLKPVTEDLGVGRGVFSLALALLTASQAIGCAFMGRLIVRYGLRRVMIPGLVLYAGSIAALATLTPSLAYIYGLFAVAGFIAAFGSPVGYGSAVVAWFDRDRGLALGLSIAGAGLGTVLAPPFVQFFISNYGWRAAYVALAAAVLAVALVPVAAFLREPPKQRYRGTGSAFARELPGLSAKEALSSALFWAFIIAFGTGAIAVLGALAHAFPFLTDKGVPKSVAVTALAASGAAVTAGRLVGGWCLDRLWGPYVAAFFYLFPMVGIALLIFGGANALILSVGVCLIGMGFGAEIDFLAFFCSRYFGPREFAQKYGIMFPALGIGSGLGPTISGATFDRFHSYVPAFILYELLLALLLAFFVRLGPYPYPAGKVLREHVDGDALDARAKIPPDAHLLDKDRKGR